MDDLDPLTIAGFLERRATAESTKTEYRHKLEKCERVLGRPLAQVTIRDLAELKAKLRQQLSGPEYIRVLKTFYRAGGREDLAALCVMKQRNRVIRPDELLGFADVVSMIRVGTTLRNRALVGALWDTGGRISEVLSANLGEVKRLEPNDGQPPAYRLFFGQTKTDEPRYAWVTDTEKALAAWLAAHPFRSDPGAPLFANADGSRLSRKRAWVLVAEAARRAGIRKKVWPHLFRHSRATYLLLKGVPEGDVKRLLGWTSRSTQLARYGHLTSGDSYRALLRAEGFAPPAAESGERVTLDDDALVPVVPVLPSGADRANRIRDAADLDRLAELLEDPEVRGFLARRLKADPRTVPVTEA